MKLAALKPTCLHPRSQRGKLVCAKVVTKKKLTRDTTPHAERAGGARQLP